MILPFFFKFWETGKNQKDYVPVGRSVLLRPVGVNKDVNTVLAHRQTDNNKGWYILVDSKDLNHNSKRSRSY